MNLTVKYFSRLEIADEVFKSNINCTLEDTLTKTCEDLICNACISGYIQFIPMNILDL